MATRNNTDDIRPGPLPDIRTEGSGVTFRLTIAGLPSTARLIIRCDADGGVWVSTAGCEGRPPASDSTSQS
jgi:hypothetical protein